MRWVAGVVVISLCGVQMPAAQTQTTAENPAQITVPAGTHIPLKLISEIHNRSTQPGDAVRAQVAFPITVGTRVAIPAGTYAEGTVQSVKALGAGGRPEIRLHFTQLVFANGYSIPLDAVNLQAMVIEPEPGRNLATYTLADARDGMPMLGEGAGQTTPTLPPLPSTGPSQGVIIGATVGAAALTTVLVIALSRRHATHADYLLFANGWQFEIELSQPLTLDASRVAAPVIPASAH